MEQFIFPALSSFVAAIITWFFSRRKSLAEDRSAELDNVAKAVKYYQDMLDDLATRLAQAIQQMKQMEIDQRALMEENRHLIDELQKFKQLNGKQ